MVSPESEDYAFIENMFSENAVTLEVGDSGGPLLEKINSQFYARGVASGANGSYTIINQNNQKLLCLIQTELKDRKLTAIDVNGDWKTTCN